jgi:hypothetical protein
MPQQQIHNRSVGKWGAKVPRRMPLRNVMFSMRVKMPMKLVREKNPKRGSSRAITEIRLPGQCWDTITKPPGKETEQSTPETQSPPLGPTPERGVTHFLRVVFN